MSQFGFVNISFIWSDLQKKQKWPFRSLRQCICTHRIRTIAHPTRRTTAPHPPQQFTPPPPTITPTGKFPRDNSPRHSTALLGQLPPPPPRQFPHMVRARVRLSGWWDIQLYIPTHLCFYDREVDGYGKRRKC